MRESFNTFEIEVKENFRKIQDFVCMIGMFSIMLSGFYILFWIGATNDNFILQEGGKLFSPLANFFYPNDTSVDLYKNTSKLLFFASFPLIAIYYFLDVLKDKIIENRIKSNEKILAIREEETKKRNLTRYDGIKMYSICLSIDYQGDKEISIENKNKFNNVIFYNIKTKLKAIDYTGLISCSDVLIYSSSLFTKYDLIYDALLKELSNSKKGIEEKYKYKLIPSITTDAYCENFKLNNVRKQHYEIQSFNFKNRALSTAMFAKKYKHLNQNKYAGIPIGEYAYFDKNSTETYELNVIHKNLSRTLG